MLAAIALGALAVGCGSSSSDSTSSAGSTKPSAEFVGNGNNKPGSFGHVASEAEREAASGVLEKNLQARAGEDWAGQCATLSADKAAQAEIYAPKKGCSGGLAAQVKRFDVSRSTLANTMTGPIAVLRVDGKLGYALYHGKKHQDYAMLMKKEEGEWKVAHLSTNEIP